MFDATEFLARGIQAARAGNPAKAWQDLDRAAKLTPGNPRVWLWLAAVCETPQQQRGCLQRALELNPEDWMARELLERFSRPATSAAAVSTPAYAFTCPRCGARMRFDPDLGSLACAACGSVEQLPAPNAFNAEQNLFTAPEGTDPGRWALLAGQIVCSQCGALLSLKPTQSAAACAFCGSPKVAQQAPTPGLISPTAILPFAFGEAQARQHLQRWLAGDFFVPAALRRLPRLRTLFGLYLPFWTFDGLVSVQCQAKARPTSRPQHDPLITDPPPHLRQQALAANERVVFRVGQTLPRYWYELSIDDLLIYAGHSALEEPVRQIGPFDLKELVEYRPAFLADWQAEIYQLSLADATTTAQQRMRAQAVSAAEKRRLVSDRTALLPNDVQVSPRTYKLILLPVWLAAYPYRGQLKHVLINGQTGKVAGLKPLDWGKIGLLLILGLSLLTALGVWLLPALDKFR